MKQSAADFLADLLKQAGCTNLVPWSDSITCSCPYHSNRRNFKTFRVSTVETVNKKTGIPGFYFHCFSCGEGGSVAKLIAFLLGCSYKKALRIFEKKTNVSSITIDSLAKELYADGTVADKEELPEIELPRWEDNYGPMLKYLKKRNRMHHGYWNIKYLIEKYSLYYCSTGRMAGRIIMPIRDTAGRIVCYNDRTIIDGEERKSLHIKGFPYGRVLHGLYESRGKKKVIVTEGAFDMFAVDCAIKGTKYEDVYGVANLMGTAFTDDRLELLVQNFGETRLMLDNDDAGINMTREIVGKHVDDIAIKNCTESYPEGKDPAQCTVDEIIHAIRHPFKRRGYLEYLTDKWENPC